MLPGWHGADFDEDCRAYIHRFSSLHQPPRVDVRSFGGTSRLQLLEKDLEAKHADAPYVYSHRPWTFGCLGALDGQRLDFRFLQPPSATPAHPAPALQLVYGGPGVRNQRRGQPEVVDEAAGTAWLAAQPFVDGRRSAVRGRSYGGDRTLMRLGRRPELYRAGVAGASVRVYRTYDTAYTERYMDDPGKVPGTYHAASALTYAGAIRDDTLPPHVKIVAASIESAG